MKLPYRKLSIVSGLVLSSIIGATIIAACDSSTSAPAPPPSTGSPVAGQAVFARYCNACHPGGGRGAGPSLIGLPFSSDQISGIVRGGKGRMPGFGPDLIPDDQLAALVAYVKALK